MVETYCAFCNKKYLKELRRFNEAKKFGWKQYCSSECQNLAKNKQKIFRCGNQTCNKTFKRSPHEIPPSGVCFCSSSCATITNNQKSPKRCPKIKICPTCQKQFSGRRKFCSESCHPKLLKVSNNQIINEIKNFYKNNGRIPLKIEYHHYKAARFRFGTWNKAIKAAGFEPNPVMFAKKYIANDGHKCDSLAEKIIDDWFYTSKIKHRIHVSYPENNSLTADFVINNCWIEYFGLDGELNSYDILKRRKIEIAKKLNLRLIALYPRDLFPINKLHSILSGIKQISKYKEQS